MMADTIRQTEILLVGYPAAPAGLSAKAAALDPDFIWQRIESYIAWRFSKRAIEWIVAGGDARPSADASVFCRRCSVRRPPAP